MLHLGSDVHYWQNGRIGDFIVKSPMVLGHEAAGLVVKVGSACTRLKPGDRIAMEPGIPCGNCNCCWGGRYNLCPLVKFAATPPVHGSLCRLFAHGERWCYKLADSTTWEEAALLEPLSVGVHAARRGEVKMGDRVFITGAGMIGLVTMMACRAAGANWVGITDINEDRMKKAVELGADEAIPSVGKDPKEVGEKLQCDVCLECSGAESATTLCIYAARSGGTVVCIGMGKPEVKIPLIDALIREVDIKGVFRYRGAYPIALDLVESGKVNVKQLVTHRFKLEKALEAFEAARTMKDNAIKVVIECTSDDDTPVET